MFKDQSCTHIIIQLVNLSHFHLTSTWMIQNWRAAMRVHVLWVSEKRKKKENFSFPPFPPPLTKNSDDSHSRGEDMTVLSLDSTVTLKLGQGHQIWCDQKDQLHTLPSYTTWEIINYHLSKEIVPKSHWGTQLSVLAICHCCDLELRSRSLKRWMGQRH